MAVDGDVLKYSAWGSHMPLMFACAAVQGGDILELGAGLYSTPPLHYLCRAQRRRLVTVETALSWLNELIGYRCGWHEMIASKTPATEDCLTEQYGIALVDIAAQHRRPCIQRLHHIPLVIVHDTEDLHARTYKWEGVLDEYDYRADFIVEPWSWVRTTVLSDTVDIDRVLRRTTVPE